jgi:WD40 repeat protein
VTSLFFSADGSKLISGSEDKKIKIWNPADLKDGKPVTTLSPESGTIVGALMIPEPPFIITVGAENKIKIWGEDGNMVFEIDTGHEGGVKSMGGNPKQAMLYSGGADGVLKYWSQGAQGAFEGKQGSAVTVIGAFADGSKILSGGADGKVKIWDAESYKEKATIEAHKGSVNAILVTPDGKLILTGGADKKVKVWSPDGKMIKEVDAHDGAVTAILYKQDKKEAAKEEKKDKP